ncbi:uncharacterized protein LOC110853714 isoform X2 [Folsomia candida]|uniref:uncharacterized protein LOC110853714 isoform X2 n=1 Tax=Folsomia candida TaxID=158441 RepID=UPI000B8F45A8|nr:uncharacterized protein LOC110853714 isoform X2 [Folsomia candida]
MPAIGESESQEDEKDDVSSPPSEDFSSVSADKVIRDGEDDGDDFNFRVPKYFQALLTLFVCFALLLCTLTIIRQTRRLCQKSACTKKDPIIRVESDQDRGVRPLNGRQNENGADPNRVKDVENGTGGGGEAASAPTRTNGGGKNFDHYHYSPAAPVTETKSAPPTPSNKTDHENDKDLLKLKRVRFVRRVSGPFADEALDFVGETYKKKVKEVVQPENLGKVQGHIRTQQSVRKLGKASAQPEIPQPSK